MKLGVHPALDVIGSRMASQSHPGTLGNAGQGIAIENLDVIE
jgi:hypothetical protein